MPSPTVPLSLDVGPLDMESLDMEPLAVESLEPVPPVQADNVDHATNTKLRGTIA